MQSSAYVVVTLGATSALPDVPFEPLQPSEAVQPVAFVELHARVEVEPEIMVSGVAVNVSVGFGVG